MSVFFGGGWGGGLWLVGLQKGVKDCVREDGVLVIKVVFGCVFCVYVEAFYGIHVGAFFL
jgi:hypothetical protein